MNRQISDSYQIIKLKNGLYLIKKYYKDTSGECEATMEVSRRDLIQILSSEVTERQIIQQLKNSIIKQLSIY